MELILYSSKRCNVCVALKPKLEEVATKYGIELKEIKIEENPAEAAQSMVFSAPTLILKEGNSEERRWSRIFSVSEVEAFLNRIL